MLVVHEIDFRWISKRNKKENLKNKVNSSKENWENEEKLWSQHLNKSSTYDLRDIKVFEGQLNLRKIVIIRKKEMGSIPRSKYSNKYQQLNKKHHEGTQTFHLWK